MPKPTLSIIIPAKDEAPRLDVLLPKLVSIYPDAEIIVVDDGSSDNTRTLGDKHGIKIISHPYNMGNGAAVKTGARHARGELLVFMDADGQHRPEEIELLLAQIEVGHDMSIGARSRSGQASVGRFAANTIYNGLASWMVNRKVEDLTSGFRAVRAEKFREFLHLLPNGFSYPTTITISFFRAGYSVTYVPIEAQQRSGKSHIKVFRDGVRFLLIIFRIGTLYSPLKLFFPAALIHFALGVGYYMYTYITMERFTNMSALLITMSVFIFLIGLISEQITMLLFQKRGR